MGQAVLATSTRALTLTSNLDPILETAKAAARQAGQALMANRDVGRVVEKEAHHFVTEADLRAERIVIETIRRRFADHAIVSEESNQAGNLQGPDVWIIDPLDGTNNFAHSIPLFCVSIAYASRGQVQVAVVYDPNRDELFAAARGHGATCNDLPIRVSAVNDLRGAIVCTGFYYDRGELMRRTLRAIEMLFVSDVRGIRRLGSAALDLCWIACGRLDGFFEYRLAPWDYAAGWLLVTEAGGTCADRDGHELVLDSGNIIAGNPNVTGLLVQKIPWSATALL
jgi:myo-inositol-1(or 4)-monophosphatase